MDGLLMFNIHKSERFAVTGNIGNRLVITDNYENKSYTIEHSELIRFRSKWACVVKTASRDKFLTLVCAYKSKEPIKKAA